MPSKLLLQVSGPPGSGKTTWIRQHLATHVGAMRKSRCAIAYWNPELPALDAYVLGLAVPQLTCCADLADLLAWLERQPEGLAVIESHPQMPLPDSGWPTERLALVSAAAVPAPGQQPSADWLDLPADLQIWQQSLQGTVFDPPSLDSFWFELVNGAYGTVLRAKGIFELPDGRAFQFNFLTARDDTQYSELAVDPWLQGRPQRPSGLVLTGQGLKVGAIAQTLADCGLSDTHLAQYQQQLREEVLG